MPTPFLSSVLGLAALILPARARAADDFAASAYFAEREPDGSVRVSIRSGDVSSPAPGAPEGVEWLRFDLRAVSSVAPEGIGGVLELKESIPRLVVRADFQLFAYAGIGVDSAGLGTVGPQGVRILLHGDDNRYRLQSEGATLSTRGSHLAVVTHGRDVEEVFLIDLRGFKPEIEAVLLPGDVKKIEPRSASVTDEAFFFAAERADGWSIFRSPLEPTSGQSLLVAERVAGPFEDVEEYFAASEGGVAFLAGRGSDELDVFVVPNSGPAVNVTQDPGPVLRHRPAEPRLALSPDALSVSYDRRVGAEPETFLHEVVAPGGSGAFQIAEDQRFNPYIDQESLIFFDGRGNLVFAAGHDVVTTDLYRAQRLDPTTPINLTRTGSGLTPPFLTKGTLAVSSVKLVPGGLALISAVGFPGGASNQPLLRAADVATGELRFESAGISSASGFIATESGVSFVATSPEGARALYRIAGTDLEKVGVALAGTEPRPLLVTGSSLIALIPGTGILDLSTGAPRVLALVETPASTVDLGSTGRLLAFGRMAPDGVEYSVLDLATGQESPLAMVPASSEILAFTERASTFLRGDSNGDGSIDVSDAIATLFYLFLGHATVPCLDAADADDDGALTVTDAVRTLDSLFRGGRPLPEPSDPPGADPTPDALDCWR